MLCRFFLFTLLLTFPLQLHGASSGKARSQGGSGLLLLPGDVRQGQLRPVLYREPGMGRIALLDIAQLPHIVPLLQVPDGWRAVIVTAKKLGWYRIIYDDGEREGWLQGRSAYQYHRWQQLLPGKRVALSGGLRKEFYQLRSTPDLAAKPLETIDRESSLTVISVAGDWINVRCGAAVNGWLRWCDDNWRLQIAVDLKAAPP